MSNYKSNLQSNNEALRANNLDLQSLIEQANNLPDAGGVELPEITTPATEDEVFLNQEYIDADGNKKTGTFTIDSELTEQDNLISKIQSMVDSLPEAGGSGASIEMCTGEVIVNAPNITDFTVYAVNENMQISTITLDAMIGGTFSVAKGTIVAIIPWGTLSSQSGECANLFSSLNGGAFAVFGDSAMIYKG